MKPFSSGKAKGLWVFLLAAMLMLTSMTTIVSAQETETDQIEYEEPFSEWNQDAPALKTDRKSVV